MKAALYALLQDQTFLKVIAGAVVAAGAHFGLHLDVGLIAAFEGTVATSILAQGLKDHGATAAKGGAS